jgi:hypothetical protein
MNPWGIIIIALGIILIYLGVKGDPHSVVKGLQSAYSQVPAAGAPTTAAKATA